MTGGTVTLLIVGSVLAAVLLDLWLLSRARQFTRRYGPAPQGVHLFGVYSPLLTWLRFRFIPDRLVSQTLRAAIILKTLLSIDRLIPVHEPATAPEAAVKAGREATSTRWLALDLGAIVVAVFLFCFSFLDLGKTTRLPGNEAEIFQTVDWTLVNSLQQYHTFPLWNPYLQTGQPFVADPMLHVYNPVVTLPVLLFGVRDGFKIAVFLSYLMAALGMWCLTGQLGMGRPTRLWAALMFAFAGQPVARFFQGEYLFVFGFAWIPWILMSLYLAMETGRRLYVATGALALALLFFSGNAYYAFLMLFIVALFAIVYLVRIKRQKRWISIDAGRFKTLLVTGILALGLVAVQLLPLVQMFPRLNKGLGVYGAHTPLQIFLDYTSRDTLRPDAYNELPAREEFYAYIGIWPFLALTLLPLAIWKRDRKVLLFLGLVLLFVVVYIDLNQMPWREAYLRTNFLLQFRHLLRPLIYGGFALILLAAYGIDTAWKFLQSSMQPGTSSAAEKVRTYLAWAGICLTGGILFAGVTDLFLTNRQHVGTRETDPVSYKAASWLRQYDLTDYYISHKPNNTWQDAVISNRLRFIHSWYPFADIRRFENNISQRPIEAQPHYIVQEASGAAPDEPGAKLIQQIDHIKIYSLPESLPMAFSVQNAELRRGAGAGKLQHKDVTPLAPFFPGPNSVEVIASSEQGNRLVVLISLFPGWELRVDGHPQAVLNAGGYLAATLLPGTHKYVFDFRPRPFYFGLCLSLIALGSCLYLVATDIRIDRLVARGR